MSMPASSASVAAVCRAAWNSDDRQPGLFREFAEPAGDVIRVQRLAELVGEHPAGVLPCLTRGEAFALAQGPVRLHALDAALVKADDALAGLRLRASPHQPSAGPGRAPR